MRLAVSKSYMAHKGLARGAHRSYRSCTRAHTRLCATQCVSVPHSITRVHAATSLPGYQWEGIGRQYTGVRIIKISNQRSPQSLKSDKSVIVWLPPGKIEVFHQLHTSYCALVCSVLTWHWRNPFDKDFFFVFWHTCNYRPVKLKFFVSCIRPTVL